MTTETIRLDRSSTAIVANRYEIVVLFDVRDGNPNGDPDNGNMPRIDSLSGEGIVTDVMLKRKIRNYIEIAAGDQPGHGIFVTEGNVLNDRIEEAYSKEDKLAEALAEHVAKSPEAKLPRGIEGMAARRLCADYFDIRAFGAVMSTGDTKGGEPEEEGGEGKKSGRKKGSTSKLKLTAGQVRGPVQVTFGRSIGKIEPIEVAITRCAVTNAADADKERTMGRKHIVPYALYRTTITVTPSLAAKSGFTEGDLALLVEALHRMFEVDRAAARGLMSTRRIIVFKHESALGNAPVHEILERVRTEPKTEIPQCFADIEISVDLDQLPQGVICFEPPY